MAGWPLEAGPLDQGQGPRAGALGHPLHAPLERPGREHLRTRGGLGLPLQLGLQLLRQRRALVVGPAVHDGEVERRLDRRVRAGPARRLAPRPRRCRWPACTEAAGAASDPEAAELEGLLPMTRLRPNPPAASTTTAAAGTRIRWVTSRKSQRLRGPGLAGRCAGLSSTVRSEESLFAASAASTRSSRRATSSGMAGAGAAASSTGISPSWSLSPAQRSHASRCDAMLARRRPVTSPARNSASAPDSGWPSWSGSLPPRLSAGRVGAAAWPSRSPRTWPPGRWGQTRPASLRPLRPPCRSRVCLPAQVRRTALAARIRFAPCQVGYVRQEPGAGPGAAALDRARRDVRGWRRRRRRRSRACPPGPVRPAAAGSSIRSAASTSSRVSVAARGVRVVRQQGRQRLLVTGGRHRRRAARRRSWSRQALTTMRCSQVVTAESPRKSPARRKAEIIASCRASAASSGSQTVRSATAHSRSRCLRNSSPKASLSPATCRRRSSVSEGRRRRMGRAGTRFSPTGSGGTMDHDVVDLRPGTGSRFRASGGRRVNPDQNVTAGGRAAHARTCRAAVRGREPRPAAKAGQRVDGGCGELRSRSSISTLAPGSARTGPRPG